MGKEKRENRFRAVLLNRTIYINNLKPAAYLVFLSITLLTIVLSGCASFLWTKNIKANKKIICLTFDDGPNGEATLKTLEVLKKYDIKAAFFVLGKNVERYPEIAKRITEEGHIIGSHSYDHNNFLALCSKKTIKNDLQKANEVIKAATGLTPQYLRPPNAILSKKLSEVSNELKLEIIGANVFINDSFITDANTIVDKCIKEIERKGGGIIVLHDGFGIYESPSRKVIPEALDRLIPLLKENGYAIITLTQFQEKR